MALGSHPLSFDVAIVDRIGRPTPEFQRAWQALTGPGGSGSVPAGYYVRTGLMNGWASPTGTASRATFATYAAPTASATYSQAQIQALMTHVQVLSQHVKAVIDDLKALNAFTS
jgi:hypothetical protein